MVDTHKTRAQDIKNKFLRIFTINILLWIFRTRSYVHFSFPETSPKSGFDTTTKFECRNFSKFDDGISTRPLAIGLFDLRCLPTLRNRISLDPLPVVLSARDYSSGEMFRR